VVLVEFVQLKLQPKKEPKEQNLKLKVFCCRGSDLTSHSFVQGVHESQGLSVSIGATIHQHTMLSGFQSDEVMIKITQHT